jgi:hypothetical protein
VNLVVAGAVGREDDVAAVRRDGRIDIGGRVFGQSKQAGAIGSRRRRFSAGGGVEARAITVDYRPTMV